MGIETYNPSAALNTVLGGFNIAEGMARADVDDALRQLMADIGGSVPPLTLPKKYGAVGDGTTDDTAAISSFNAASGPKYLPDSLYKTTLAPTVFDGPFRGFGQMKDASNNKRGPFFAAVKAAPTSLGNHSSVETAFNGDLSKSLWQVEHRITGAASLSQPTTGYVYTPEAYPFYGVLYNLSGWNQATAGNTGRTAAAFFRVNLQQYGQGDCVAFNATAIVNGARAGATSFLANPAASLFNGDMTAGQAGVYLNPREIALNDGGFDVACVGDVMNFNRSVSTGALGTWWGGYRIQSTGTQPINNLFSATGTANAGIDFSMSSLDFGANKCAIGLKANDRIYFDNASSTGNYADTFNGKYLQYNSSISAIEIVYGSTSLQISASKVLFAQPTQLPTVVTSALPAAATANKGMEYYVSDANATTRLSTVVGGGANFVKVFSTGSAWVIQ